MGYEFVGLTNRTLGVLRDRGLTVPDYDRGRLLPRIVHIGVGGFHRAHLALYCDHLARMGGDWGICGVGLLPGDAPMAEALNSQDHLYTFTTKSTGVTQSEVVGSIIGYVLAVDDHTPAVERVAAPVTSIVSMTVTESGYDDTTRNRRTFDVIAEGLDRRRVGGRSGVTVLSCDNLPGNGDAARSMVLDAADRRDRSLADWVVTNCTFPNSMVDRITPVTANSDRQYLLDAYGLIDRWPVVGEPFWQWVLEDDFASGRPDFAAAGASYTADVRAWELYKLRMLNVGHSAIAYLCALADVVYVDEALAMPEVRDFLTRLLLEEAAPTLIEIPGHPAEEYARTVIERFSNSAVSDQIARLCVDGTSKFPTFLMPSIVKQLDEGGPIERSAHALAGWAHYLADTPVEEQAIDALGHLSRPLAIAAKDDPAVFIDESIGFPAEITASQRFAETFCVAHRAIAERGALAALAALLTR